MIEISNLRKYAVGGGVRLEADITFTDMLSPYPEKTLYFEVDKANGDMLADDTYDAFVLVPLYLAMFHKQDLHIRGKISKKLYQNIKWYVQKIFCDFSPDLAPVKFTVDGFTSAKRKGNLIGAGISCGVDSLSTIYDHFVKETDPDYRINALFYFDHDLHNQRFDNTGQKLYKTLLRRNTAAAKDLNLPLYALASNSHTFNRVIDKIKKRHISMIFLAQYSCAFSLGKNISRYYTSSGMGYEEIKNFSEHYHNDDLSAFCESYLVPLIQTDRTELIVDGCQYRRVDKLKKMVDWNFAQKHLNVCFKNNLDGSNCGVCAKCLRTLLPLEILGKLEKFSRVFNIEQYRRISFNYKVQCLQKYGEHPFMTENVDFAHENNFPMPTKRDCYVLGNQATIV